MRKTKDIIREIAEKEEVVFLIEKLIAEAKDEARKELIEWAKNHYWDSLQKDKDIIILHLERSFNDFGENSSG